MNYSLNVKSSSIVHTLLSNCVKLLSIEQKLLILRINCLVISKRIRAVSPKFYTVRKNFTGPTNLKSVSQHYPNHHSLISKRPKKNVIERTSFKQYNCLTMTHKTFSLKYDRTKLSFLDQRKKQMFHYLSSVNKPLNQRHIAIHCKVLKSFESGESTGWFNYF